MRKTIYDNNRKEEFSPNPELKYRNDSISPIKIQERGKNLSNWNLEVFDMTSLSQSNTEINSEKEIQLNPQLEVLNNLNLRSLETNENLNVSQKIFLFCSFQSFKSVKIMKQNLSSSLENSGGRSSGILKNKHFGNSLKIDCFDEIYKNIVKYIQKFYFEDFKIKNKETLNEILYFIWKSSNNFDFESFVQINLPTRISNDSIDNLRKTKTMNYIYQDELNISLNFEETKSFTKKIYS